MSEIEITTDRARISLDVVHRYLSEESYWAAGIPREVVERAMEHSLCFAALDGDATIGFARVVTDRATFAYLADSLHRGVHACLRYASRISFSMCREGLASSVNPNCA